MAAKAFEAPATKNNSKMWQCRGDMRGCLVPPTSQRHQEASPYRHRPACKPEAAPVQEVTRRSRNEASLPNHLPRQQGGESVQLAPNRARQVSHALLLSSTCEPKARFRAYPPPGGTARQAQPKGRSLQVVHASVAGWARPSCLP